MLTKTNNTQNTEQNAEENGDNSPLIIHEQIQGTPFHITGNEEKGYFIRMGGYRLTDQIQLPDLTISENLHEITETMTEYLEDNKWNIILTMMAAVEHAQGRPKVNLNK